ncbi:Mbeg1-like protein [Paenibacillus glufosinatiresistens]|uniref:Mbeg1-like protein n=1 Tax=Paenibacillus glufosinatiresistens TaxID=3070657 RepID=UPI00286E39DB|nr:Mbeg1-like protein [Paenibacillus sp. YX.27]
MADDQKLTEVELKQISQLVYLDVIDSKGVGSELEDLYFDNGKKITVGQLIDYYTAGEGLDKLKARYPDKLNGTKESEQWIQLLESMDTDKYRNWEITDVVSHNKLDQSGFVAFTVDTKNGAKVAAFRGSEPINDPYYRNDWKNNGTTAYELESLQQREARAYMQKFGLHGEDLYITGHSLGGNLSLFSSFVMTDDQRSRLISVSTFNAPGFNKALLDQYRSQIDAMNGKGQILEYRNKHDLVPALFLNPSDGIYIDTTSDAVTGFSHHSLFSFAQDDGSTFHRSDSQMRAVIPNLVHHVTVGLEAVPSFLKETLVTEVFKIWDGDVEWYHVLFGAAAVAGIALAGPWAVLLGALKVVAALYVIGFVIDKVIPWIKEGVAHVAELVETFFNEAVEVITGLYFQAVDAAKLIGSRIAEFARQVKSAVTQFFHELKEGFKQFVADTIQFVEAQKEKFIRMKEQVARKLGDIFESVKSTITRKKDEVVDGVRTFKNKLIGGLKAKIKTVAKYAVSAAGAVRSAQIKATVSRIEALHQLLRQKEERISDLVARIRSVASGVSSSVGGAYPESYVQSALRELEQTQQEIRSQERRVSETLKQQSDGVKYSVNTYRSTEAKLSAMARA